MDTVKVGVVGLGTMGAGIVEVLAGAELSVVGLEYDENLLERGRERLMASTERACRRGKLSEPDRERLLGRVGFTTSYDELAGCGLVVEAVSERLDLKREIFTRLDGVTPPETILATNTSSLSVTEIAVTTKRPNRVVGMHFFNPAPVQRLVEVVRSVETDAAVVDEVAALAQRLGKSPVVVGDRAGFIANALLFGYLNRAVAMYGAGQAVREDLDAAVRLGLGYPMGPLALLDLIGLDTAYEILGAMYCETGSRMHAAAPLLRELVAAGRLGRKSGRGFYSYRAPGSSTTVSDEHTPEPAPRPAVRTVGLVAQHGADPVRAVLASAGVAIVESGDPQDRRLAGCELLIAAGIPAPMGAAASGADRAGDLVGMHVPADGVVEVVRTVASSHEAVVRAVGVCEAAGAQPVVCADRAGRLVDALLYPYLCDAVRMVQDGYATADDVDTAMTLGCALPEGPFAALDRMGLDAALAGQQVLYEAEREPGLVPPLLLRQLVAAGRLGRKSGRGFREHE